VNGAKRRKSSASSVGDVLRGVFSQIDQKKEMGEEEIRGVWTDAAGTAGSRHSSPVSLSKKVLRVHVDSPGWMQELTMQKRKVLKKLQSHFGKDKIQEIHFRIGEF